MYCEVSATTAYEVWLCCRTGDGDGGGRSWLKVSGYSAGVNATELLRPLFAGQIQTKRGRAGKPRWASPTYDGDQKGHGEMKWKWIMNATWKSKPRRIGLGQGSFPVGTEFPHFSEKHLFLHINSCSGLQKWLRRSRTSFWVRCTFLWIAGCPEKIFRFAPPPPLPMKISSAKHNSPCLTQSVPSFPFLSNDPGLGDAKKSRVRVVVIKAADRRCKKHMQKHVKFFFCIKLW